MRRLGVQSFVFAFTVAAAACGNNPIAPTEPSVSTVSALSISASRTELPIGGTETLRATIKLGNGSTSPVPSGRWRSDAPTVAVVDDGGHLRGVGVGRANIILEFGEARASLPVTVRVDFSGRWAGAYTIDDCVETGDFAAAEVCKSYFPKTVYAPREVALALAQNGDSLSGAATFDQFEASLAPAPIAQDGSVRTTSSFAYYDGRVKVEWTLRHGDPERLDGGFVMTWTHVSKSGSMTVTGSLKSLAPAPAGGGTPPLAQ